MTILFFFSLLVASMLGLTAYLQSEARWWTGPAWAVLLVVLGFLAAYFVPLTEATGFTSPAAFLVVGAWWCGVIIGIGSVSALVLRRFRNAGQVAGIAFLGGWMLTFLWFLTGGFI